ncbi:unnamed protein product [Tuber aestivum]|uniref:SAP domain-containing protein n=1 Tax=Tuber aestivum TaxID=59557 RepID=A0A292PUV9_9PEZI|nr:unnamed protein product [Tuber aestivum]
MPSKKELQIACRAAGIQQLGTVAELTERLRTYRNHEPSSSPATEDSRYDAILGTQSVVGIEEEMKVTAEAALGKELKKSELDISTAGRETYVSNPRGRGLAGLPERIRILQERDVLSDQMIALQDGKLASQDREIAELKDNVAELERSVVTLTLAGQDYRLLRERFISTFVHDKLENATQSDLETIKEVNITVHGGDAAVDALLYDGIGGRQDTYTFEELYGMHPSDVRNISHQETIDILNLHATVKANKDGTGTEDFYQKFGQFVTEFKRSNFKVTYLSEDHTDRTQMAYLAVRQCPTYTPSTEAYVITKGIPLPRSC